MAEKPSAEERSSEGSQEEGGPEVLAQTEPEAQPEGIELGDTIEIEGGKYNGTIAVVYGLYESDGVLERIMIQTIGDTTSVKQIDVVNTTIDGEDYNGPDPALGIESINILEKAPLPGFVNLIQLRAGVFVEAFSNGEKYGEYQIVSVNEENDSARIMDDTGAKSTIPFSFQGIPRDLPIDVLRVKPDPLPPADRDEGNPNAQTAAAPVGEVDDENVEAGEGGDEGDDEEISLDVEFGDEIDIQVKAEVKQLSSADRLYPDIYQRSEMLAHLIRLLPEPKQKDPIALQEVRRLVEMMLILRNDVVRYGKTGEPRGSQRTTFETIADMLKQPSGLTRKVVAMQKVLLLDRHWENPALDAPEGEIFVDGESTNLYGRYAFDIIQQAETLLKTAEMETGEGHIGMLPKTYTDLEKYRTRIHTPYLLTRGDKVVQQDEEVFQNIVPDLEGDERLTALPRDLEHHRIIKDVGEVGVFNPPATPFTKVPFATSRLLKPRKGRFISGERERVIETGDAPTTENTLLFPLSTLRDLGPIRSGSLAKDISLGMQRPNLMRDILEEHPISEAPSADDILNYGVKGNILGNVTIKDWLVGLDMVLNGGGDARALLQAYGMSGVEFSIEQMEVIQEKIEQHLAALRIYMKEQRETNASMLANLKFIANPVLEDADAAALLTRLESDTELLKVLEDTREFMGELASVDANWFSQIFLRAPDYTIAILGQQAEIIAKERQRYLRDQYLIALQNGFRLYLKDKLAGKAPTPNTCIHVEELAKTRRAGHKYADEPGDVTRMKLFIKFFNRFRGEIKDNWVHCNVCKKHLVCNHEYLQMQEFLKPKSKETLHKELLLQFSGGAFAGKFICKVCGQGISDMDFETSIEFDDEGRPMMGRSELVDEDEVQKGVIDDILTGPNDIVEEMNFGSPELNFYYKVLKRVAEVVGINPEETDYRKMVVRMNEYVMTIPNREAYAILTRGKQADDYDIYLNIRIIASAGAIILLNVQTRMPDYIVKYSNAQCRKGLMGYPLEQNDNFTGIQCIVNTLLDIRDREPPWNLSGLQGKDLLKRTERLTKYVKGLVDEFVKNPIVQTELRRKREYQQSTLGYVGSEKKDVITKTFRPIPYVVEAEEAAAAALVADAASEKEKATAWIRAAHAMAASAASLNPDSKYTETTCCLNGISQPQQFWREASLPALEPRSLGAPPFRSNTLTTTFYTEAPKLVEGELSSSEYFKLFMRICHDGPNKGLPHELGLGDQPLCSQCGLKFTIKPSLALVEDIVEGAGKKKMEEIKKEYEANVKASIESQGIEITEESFLDLLRTTQQRSMIPKEDVPTIPSARDTLSHLAEGPAPLEGWREILQQIQLNFNDLGTSPTEIQVAKAVEQLDILITRKEEVIRKRIKEAAFRVLESFARRSPRECGEAVLTYLVVPFQRWLNGVNLMSFRMLDSYEVSDKVKSDVMEKGLAAHLQIVGGDVIPVGIIRAKIEMFCKEMSYYCKEIFPNLRTITTPGGRLMVNYLLSAYILGPIQKLIDPLLIPAGVEREPLAANFNALYNAIGQSLTKYVKGTAIPSEDEIRTMLEQRAEEEKQVKLDRLDKKSKEGRQVDIIQRKLGMGEYARGGSKAIQEYDDDEYERLRQEREEANITDWDREGEAGEEGGAYDMFQMQREAMEERDGGYDNRQEADDDF